MGGAVGRCWLLLFVGGLFVIWRVCGVVCKHGARGVQRVCVCLCGNKNRNLKWTTSENHLHDFHFQGRDRRFHHLDLKCSFP